jgi:hypothetical protein
MSASMPAYMSDPTEEQLAALNMARDHKSFQVVAYAGAGKTTTLKLIGERLRGRFTCAGVSDHLKRFMIHRHIKRSKLLFGRVTHISGHRCRHKKLPKCKTE